jgi:two-component system, cell cycle response regulator
MKKKSRESNLSDKTDRHNVAVDPVETTEKEHKKKEVSGKKTPCFIVLEGDFIGEIYPIDKKSATVGRAQDCDIVIADSSISRKHLKVEKTQDGFLLKDLGSTNGIWVNDLRCQEHPLADGDKVQLGKVVLRFGFEDHVVRDYHKKMRTMAIKDGLTQVFNKTYFMEALTKELAFSARTGIPLSLLVFDIDDFKSINDTYGHTVGDNVLRKIAAILKEEVRGYDIFARFGGEEFVFLLRGITPKHTKEFGERIRTLVEEHKFTLDGERKKITISIGGAFFGAGKKPISAEEFLNEADQLLYQAKRKGKNQLAFPSID